MFIFGCSVSFFLQFFSASQSGIYRTDRHIIYWVSNYYFWFIYFFPSLHLITWLHSGLSPTVSSTLHWQLKVKRFWCVSQYIYWWIYIPAVLVLLLWWCCLLWKLSCLLIVAEWAMKCYRTNKIGSNSILVYSQCFWPVNWSIVLEKYHYWD